MNYRNAVLSFKNPFPFWYASLVLKLFSFIAIYKNCIDADAIYVNHCGEKNAITCVITICFASLCFIVHVHKQKVKLYIALSTVSFVLFVSAYIYRSGITL